MICDSCIHTIFRTYRNGPNEEYYRWSCDIDGKELNVQLHACTRKEEMVKSEPVVESIVEPALPPVEEVSKSTRWKKRAK